MAAGSEDAAVELGIVRGQEVDSFKERAQAAPNGTECPLRFHVRPADAVEVGELEMLCGRADEVDDAFDDSVTFHPDQGERARA